MDSTLTIAQAAKLLGVHPNTLRRWEKERKLFPERNRATKYRKYSVDLIRDYLFRGAVPKIDVHWGYDYSKKARVEELEQVRHSLDVIVSSNVSTVGQKIDGDLILLLKEAVQRGVKGRFIRDLSDLEMKSRAEKMKLLGVETKDQKFFDLTISIRDRQVVRIEMAGDNSDMRFNLVINDKKIAKSFSMFFEKVWYN